MVDRSKTVRGVAEQLGLQAAPWLFLAGPVALWMGLSRRETDDQGIARPSS